MDEKSQGVQVGFFGFLTLLLIGLKLTGHCAFEWKWVLAPLWMPFCLWLLIASTCVVVAFRIRSRR